MREIRDHRPGDPYKRIAWKASARRGRLLIIEKEQEETDAVWIVIEASVDSASGPIGKSPLDTAIDHAVATIDAHLARGDTVGLAVVGSRVLAKISPRRGPKHAAQLVSALALKTHTADADRSDWDEDDVARKVLEHASTIDPEAARTRPYEHEKLRDHARRLLLRAPAQPPVPWAPLPAERIFRQYLLSFGIQPPPRTTSDRHRAEREIAELIRQIQTARPKPSLIYLYGTPPTFETPKQLLDVLASIPKRRTEVRFVPYQEVLRPSEKGSVRERIVYDALGHRQKMAREDGIIRLTRAGVILVRDRHRRRKLPRSDA